MTQQAEQPAQWDVEADVVVLGSGGAALVAALSAHHHGASEVVVLEKSNMVGGTTAMSGGRLRRRISRIRLPEWQASMKTTILPATEATVVCTSACSRQVRRMASGLALAGR